MSSIANTNMYQTPGAETGMVSNVLSSAARRFVAGQMRQFSGLRLDLFSRCKVDGLALPLASLFKGNAAHASKLYRGEFNFLDEVFVRSENNIFNEQSPSQSWQDKLHGFSWLVDMQTAGRELVRAQSRALILEWIKSGDRQGRSGLFRQRRNSDVLARRVTSWVCYAPFFLENCPDAFAEQFFASIGAQARCLYRRTFVEKNSFKRLQSAIGLAYATIGLEGLEGMRTKAFERLAVELDAQILADGGHVSRNPQVLRDLLGDLVPIRMALEAGRVEVPPVLNGALERMLPALRFFTYMDGGLAVFNGVSDTHAGLSRRILETDRICGAPLREARHSGYARLHQGNSTVMIDMGKPTMPFAGGHAGSGATAGVLAFEFCDGASRLVTNCGAIANGDEAWRAASRSTQAHSALCLADQPAGGILEGFFARLAFGGPVVLSAPNVNGQSQTGAQGAGFSGGHDGYQKSLGVEHCRELFLSSDGSDFRGQDSFIVEQAEQFEQGEGVPFAIRFHLHPSVRVTISQDGASAMLLLANKAGWRFSARGAQLKLEDSVYLPENGRMRKTSQLVLRGAVGQSNKAMWANKVMWAFKRIEKRKGAKVKTAAPKLL